MSERAAAHLDREAARLELGAVDVRRRCVPGLVDRDRAGVGLVVLDVDRRVPDSITVIASTRSLPDEVRPPSWWASVSAIEQIWSIIAGE